MKLKPKCFNFHDIQNPSLYIVLPPQLPFSLVLLLQLCYENENYSKYIFLGTKSYRDTQFGSWYIKAIAESFCEHAQKDHVLDIFTKVI